MSIIDHEIEKREKLIRSAFDSPTFEEDVTIHVERDVGSATISPSGRDVALASLDGLDIIDLDRPYTRPRHLRHTTSWSVADVQWSPFAARDYWVVSTSNQKALVWNLTMSENSYQGAVEHTLHAHSRAITDINFSAHHPDILSTCAVDGYVNCWDLRRPRRPCMTFVDWFAGATQVKWNRQDEHILASSHDRWLRIWDDRKGAYPLRTIEAHDSKVYGVDWNRTRSTGIVTCSLDRSIKFWDFENPEDIPERVIRTDFPVWRARHTPFGWGLLAMPQDKPGDLHLYDRRLDYDKYPVDSAAPAAKTFPGHGQNKVKEFLWRVRGSITDEGIDDREFQLVSWGEDGELRLQHIDPTVLKSVGYERGSQVRKKLNMTRKGAVYKSFRDVESVAEKKLAAITGPRPSTGLKLQSSLSSTNVKRMSPPKAIQGNSMPVAKDKKRPTSGNQIGWISGIKFNKKAETAEQSTGAGRRFSIMSPTYNLNDWDEPESLHEEIIRIHAQYSKVTFDDVNLDKRSVLVSMNGPWGSGGSSVFIKVNIDFPDQYPESGVPKFVLGKSSNISEELSEKIVDELHQLAEGFASRKQGCLEAALCYLLGEVNLEESATAWFMDEQSLDDNSDGLADESSSDEDGDIPPGASAMMSQELDASGAGEIPRNGNANVPLPRLCGAVFSRTGKLVCFFPPKEDKVKSLLGNLSAGMRVSRGEKKFETFGRLKNESPGPRNNVPSIADESRYDSDSSEGSYSSSSDSDSSPFPHFPVQYWRSRARSRRYLKALSTNQSLRSSGGGTGTGTGTGTAFSKGRALKPKNTISIHDLEAFSPAKKVLAQEYAIFGEGPAVCETNARVAEEHGYQDLADVWRYAKLILLDDIPLEVLTRENVKEPILIVAKDAIRRSRRNSRDSGVDVSEGTKQRATGFSGRVKWGHNPLARKLIDDLFHHFEHPADIQMLAMLSCVFSEPAAQDSVSQFEMHRSQPATPMSMKTPAFSLDYFPSDSAAWNLTQLVQGPRNSSPKPAHTPQGIFGSMGSNGYWGSDPNSGTYSPGVTPPGRSTSGDTPPGRATPRNSTDLGHSNTHSLSTSPETSRLFRRANSSGLASSFAASFSRPFNMSSSPPNRKRPSPETSKAMLSSLAPANVTWGSTTILGSVKEDSQQEIPPDSEDEYDEYDEPATDYTGISLTMEIQDIFDDEGCMSAPLLDVKHTARFSSYRKAYAELLFIWGQHLSRLEILKFSGLPDYFTISSTGEETRPFANKSYPASVASNDNASTIEATAPPSPILLGRNNSQDTQKENRGSRERERQNIVAAEMGVNITGYCLKHECRLLPLPMELKSKINVGITPPPSNAGAVGHCERCNITQRQLCCVICTEPLSALYTPCLSCGCASHQSCILAMHAAGEILCAGGCDCVCIEKAELGVVESWDVMMGMINMRKSLAAGEKGGYVSGDDQSFFDRDRGGEKDGDREWDAGDSREWDDIPKDISGTAVGNNGFSRMGLRGSGTRSPGLGGTSAAAAALLGTRLDRVRAGDWGGIGIGGGLRRKASSLRRERSFESR